MANGKWQMANGKWQMANKIVDIRHWIFDSGYSRRGRGFTLVELLIYMGIFTILMTVLTQLFVSIIDTKLSSEATSSVAGDGRYIYSRIIYDVNHATAIASPSAYGDISNSLQLTVGGGTYTYQLVNGKLQLTTPTGTSVLNGYDTTLSAIQFQRIGNVSGKPTVQIKYTIVGITTARGKIESNAFQTTAGLR